MNNLFFAVLVVLLSSTSVAVVGKTKTPALSEHEVVRLSYIEREPGVDEYEVVLHVSDRYIRLDEPGDESGYIIYDDREKVIYSVSHADNSVLLIRQYPFTVEQQPVKHQVEYLRLSDAPKVSQREVYNYRAYIEQDGLEVTCTELQIVEGLLPEVTALLHNYQKVVSGQQVKMTDNNVTEFQDGCFFVDQIYNTGAYYEKGLPIQEWHSNDRSRILTSYKKVKFKSDQFSVPENYRQFSIDKDSKTFIK